MVMLIIVEPIVLNYMFEQMRLNFSLLVRHAVAKAVLFITLQILVHHNDACYRFNSILVQISSGNMKYVFPLIMENGYLELEAAAFEYCSLCKFRNPEKE